MNDTKPWYLSTSVWASLVQVLVGLAVALGFVDAAAGTTIAEQAPGLIIAIVTAVAGALGLYGRVTATTQITVTSDPNSTVVEKK